MSLTLKTGVEALPGVGPARAKALARLGLTTVGDLLGYYPRNYEDRRKSASIASAPADVPVCLTLMVAEPPRLSRIRKGLELVKVRLVDDTGSLTATFFNQAYLKDALRTGETYVCFGRVEGEGARRQMTNPVCERMDKVRFTGRILPVYSLTHGVSNNLLAGLTLRCVEECAGQVEESLPHDLRQAHQLAEAEFAVRNVHFPADEDALAVARRRLIFEELFYLTCGMALLRTRRDKAAGLPFERVPEEDFLNLLPFSLTGAQRRVIGEMTADLCSGSPMNRLVQGDVGSGKTMLAAYGAWLAAKNGYQCALMAPTELLAEQHYRSLAPLLEQAGMRVGLVHGKMKSKEKDAVMTAFAAGELDVLVSTTVIEVGVDVPNAALMIVENADRFGLSQLHQLRGRVGRGKHQSYCVLVTATRSQDSRERLRILSKTNDGFKIAEEDLRLRGPGDFFGSRQHGLPQLGIADLAGDMRVLKEAQTAAEELLRADPGLTEPEHAGLLARVKRLFAEQGDVFN